MGYTNINKVSCAVLKCYFNNSHGECQYTDCAELQGLVIRQLTIGSDGYCACMKVNRDEATNIYK